MAWQSTGGRGRDFDTVRSGLLGQEEEREKPDLRELEAGGEGWMPKAGGTGGKGR